MKKIKFSIKKNKLKPSFRVNQSDFWYVDRVGDLLGASFHFSVEIPFISFHFLSFFSFFKNFHYIFTMLMPLTDTLFCFRYTRYMIPCLPLSLPEITITLSPFTNRQVLNGVSEGFFLLPPTFFIALKAKFLKGWGVVDFRVWNWKVRAWLAGKRKGVGRSFLAKLKNFNIFFIFFFSKKYLRNLI